MGRLMSSGFGRDGSRPDHGHCFGPGRTSFSSSLASIGSCRGGTVACLRARVDQPSLLPPRATPSDTARRLEHKLVGESRASTIRGELAIGRGSSRHNLVFGRSRGSLTMMQACASAAKLRGGGPILENGVKPWPASGDRHLGSSLETDDGLFARFRELVLSAFARHAARKTRPAGTSPVVTIRHSAISSFLARATIKVLRVPPRASAVRARYHCASALSF